MRDDSREARVSEAALFGPAQIRAVCDARVRRRSSPERSACWSEPFSRDVRLTRASPCAPTRWRGDSEDGQWRRAWWASGEHDSRERSGARTGGPTRRRSTDKWPRRDHHQGSVGGRAEVAGVGHRVRRRIGRARHISRKPWTRPRRGVRVGQWLVREFLGSSSDLSHQCTT